jgi:hypothetical protein
MNMLNKNEMDKQEEEEHHKLIQELTFKKKILEQRVQKVCVLISIYATLNSDLTASTNNG